MQDGVPGSSKVQCSCAPFLDTQTIRPAGHRPAALPCCCLRNPVAYHNQHIVCCHATASQLLQVVQPLISKRQLRQQHSSKGELLLPAELINWSSPKRPLSSSLIPPDSTSPGQVSCSGRAKVLCTVLLNQFLQYSPVMLYDMQPLHHTHRYALQ